MEKYCRIFAFSLLFAVSTQAYLLDFNNLGYVGGDVIPNNVSWNGLIMKTSLDSGWFFDSRNGVDGSGAIKANMGENRELVGSVTMKPVAAGKKFVLDSMWMGDATESSGQFYRIQLWNNNSKVKDTMVETRDPIRLKYTSKGFLDSVRVLATPGGHITAQFDDIAYRWLPDVQTNAAQVSGSIVALKGTLNAYGSEWNVTFEYGFNTSYGFIGIPNPGSYSDASSHSVSFYPTSLIPRTLYHYRLKAVSQNNEVFYGQDITFTTSDNSQYISFPNPGDQTYGSNLYIAASTTSGLALTYTTKTPSVCLVNSLGAVSFLDVGQCEIEVSQPGNASYSAAPSVSQSFGILPKHITIVASSQTKNYGEMDPVLSYSVTGLVNGDALTGALSRAAGENVGSYDILQGTLANSRYIIDYTAAKLTIQQAPTFVQSSRAAIQNAGSVPAKVFDLSGRMVWSVQMQ
jgi:hypothetical protein